MSEQRAPTSLWLAKWQLDCSEGATLDAAACGGFPRLVSLYLHNNHLSDRSLLRLAHVLGAGALPALEHCWLQGNDQISDVGVAALRVSLQSAPNVTQLYVRQRNCAMVNLAPNGPP